MMKLQVIKHNSERCSTIILSLLLFIRSGVFLSNRLTLEIFVGLHANGDRSKMKKQTNRHLHDCNTSI